MSKTTHHGESMATKVADPVPLSSDALDPDASRDVAILNGGVDLAAGINLFAQADDPSAEPTDLDPGGDIATDFRSQLPGRPIVITRWGLSPSAEQYANANLYGMFTVLGFYFADDSDHKGRFTTTGSTRIVETVQDALARGTRLPVRATVVAFTTRGGEGYRFLRPGETVR